MNLINNGALFFQTVFKKSIIAFPFLIIVYLVYGINTEHGDANAGSMYPLVFAPHFVIISLLSYALYFIADQLIMKTRWNFLKNVIHLILGVGLIWFDSKRDLVVVLPTLITILIVNLLSFLYYKVTRAS
ncbi:MAG: hypothetical protein JWR05_206 [Mucilaginibacter sp.]|nr:hypothetical protein [Mucilaginibacter sp.]